MRQAEKPMRRGYITCALNTPQVDYLRMAYCLALSLRTTQTISALTVVVDPGSKVPKKWDDAFDNVIELTGSDLSVGQPWRVHNYFQLYELSPYDQTVTLDADMLFFDDVGHWWDRLSGNEIVLAQALNYRGEPIVYNPLRKDLYEIGLPDLHNGFLYFEKSAQARNVFQTIGEFFADWDNVCTKYFGRGDVPLSSDCGLLLAIRENGMGATCRRLATGGIPAFIHMKACLQGWPGVAESERDWRPFVDYGFVSGPRLFIDGVQIRLPLHYHVRDFVTNSLIKMYESIL